METKKFWQNRFLKKPIGILLIMVGLFALVTPFTPGSWLALVGLELLGVRLLFIERIKKWLVKKPKDK